MNMIGFCGLSHLGIVSGIAVASKGFDVVAFDANAGLTAALSKGDLPVHEPDLPQLLDKSSKHIRFTSILGDLAKCDLVYISLDVKTDLNNVSDLSGLTALIDPLVDTMKADAVLVILSQVPPGFTRRLAQKYCDRKIQVYGQVETLIFGRAVERALHPERYIVGCADPSKSLPDVFKKILSAFDCPILPMRYESSELAKISINMFLVSSVSTTNTLAELCEAIGAEWAEIAPALRLDKRIGPHAYLGPGLGIAGGNLERDLATISSLSKEFGTDAGIVDAWVANSRYRCDWALRTAHREVFAKIEAPVVGILGIAYKQDTKSVKNSPSLVLIQGLGTISMRAYDPQVVLRSENLSTNLKQVDSALEACRGADTVILMTPWKEFYGTDIAEMKKLMRGKTVIDPHGILNPEDCKKAGLKYFRLGTGASC